MNNKAVLALVASLIPFTVKAHYGEINPYSIDSESEPVARLNAFVSLAHQFAMGSGLRNEQIEVFQSRNFATLKIHSMDSASRVDALMEELSFAVGSSIEIKRVTPAAMSLATQDWGKSK